MLVLFIRAGPDIKEMCGILVRPVYCWQQLPLARRTYQPIICTDGIHSIQSSAVHYEDIRQSHYLLGKANICDQQFLNAMQIYSHCTQKVGCELG